MCFYLFCVFTYFVYVQQTAEKLNDKKLTTPDDKAARCAEQEEPGPSSTPLINTIQFVPW